MFQCLFLEISPESRKMTSQDQNEWRSPFLITSGFLSLNLICSFVLSLHIFLFHPSINLLQTICTPPPSYQECCLSVCILIVELYYYFVLARSGDSTARIWTIPDGPCGSLIQSSPPSVHVLKHFKGRTNEKSKDVTTLDWNVSLLML